MEFMGAVMTCYVFPLTLINLLRAVMLIHLRAQVTYTTPMLSTQFEAALVCLHEGRSLNSNSTAVTLAKCGHMWHTCFLIMLLIFLYLWAAL